MLHSEKRQNVKRFLVSYVYLNVIRDRID